MTKQLTEDELIRQAKANYQKEWKNKNKKHVNQYNKMWRQANPEKVAANNRRYWLRKAKENNA